MASQGHCIRFEGCNFFRQRLLLSTLSGRPVKIQRIREKDESPGLRGKDDDYRALCFFSCALQNVWRLPISSLWTVLHYSIGIFKCH